MSESTQYGSIDGQPLEGATQGGPTQAGSEREGQAHPRDEGDGRDLPSPEELNAEALDGSGDDAVSAQPFDTDPADLEDARERVVWDADTDRP